MLSNECNIGVLVSVVCLYQYNPTCDNDSSFIHCFTGTGRDSVKSMRSCVN